MNNNMIIFLHFHKAAGTSIIHMLKREKKFFNPNKNGNPCIWLNKITTQTINYWNNNKKKIMNWIANQKKRHVDVLCLEWNFFNPNNIIFKNITYITSIREPLSRFFSCFNFEKSRKIGNNINLCPNIFQKIDFYEDRFLVTYNKDNYYTRMLCGLGDNIYIKIDENHLKYAKSVLDKFSVIIIVENKNSFELLRKINLHNRTIVYNHIKSYKEDLYTKYKNFSENFKKANKIDYELYEYAKILSDNMLNELSNSISV